jgi:CsoR family transcriptional regulator, copper-sensing transcriptional repressor
MGKMKAAVGEDCCHGAGTADAGGTKKPVHIDPAARARNVTRLKRAEGQVRGVIKMVEEDRYCADVLVQIAAARESLQAVAREVLHNHMAHCVAQSASKGGAQAEETLAELKRLVDQLTR